MDGNPIAICRHHGCFGTTLKAITGSESFKEGKKEVAENTNRHCYPYPNYNFNATSCKTLSILTPSKSCTINSCMFENWLNSAGSSIVSTLVPCLCNIWYSVLFGFFLIISFAAWHNQLQCSNWVAPRGQTMSVLNSERRHYVANSVCYSRPLAWNGYGTFWKWIAH